MPDAPEILDNRYEIIKRLGSGGMADVFLARDRDLGREVAIKILYERYARDDEFVARFRREAQAAAGLNHPHIVSIYDRGEADGSYYIAMEYLEGKSLKDVIIEHGKLPPAQAISVAGQILQALQFAHDHNVIHRDIKPHNIVINGQGQVKVTDFGIARAGTSAKMTETGSILGTAQYLSPEQAKGKAVEQGSDLYSVGVVLYEMLTGQVPFEGENPVAIALKHLSDDPVPPQVLVPEIPDNLNMVVMRALAKDPRDRYQNAGEFLADLDRVKKNLPVTAPAASDTDRTNVIPAAAAAAMMGRPANDARTMIQPAAEAGAAGGGKPSRRKWLYLALVVAILALIGAGVFLLAFAQQGSVEVPNVVGMDQAQAENAIRAQDLSPVIDSQDYSDTIPAGKVLSQNPPAGSKISKNGAVHLVISLGTSKVMVPDGLAGQTASFVEAKLREVGLNPNRQPDTYSSTVAEGNVISVDPASGTPVQKGSAVKYVVSKGPAPPKVVTVPDVTGLSVGDASSKLSQAGLALGSTSEKYSDSVPSGEIISQNPAAGSQANQGSSVNVVASKGPQPSPQVTVPSVQGQTAGQAAATLGAAGLALGNITKQPSLSVPVGHIISQNPAAGTKVDPGSSVDVVVSTGPD